MKHEILPAFFSMALVVATTAHAGPPYATDDPDPVGYQHYEFYFASIANLNGRDWSGAGPFIDANYGALPDLHLHLLVAANYFAPAAAAAHYGLGDIELGAKFRFIHETESMPQVATYPLVEIPTGEQNEGLGNGHLQFFVPLWIQKTFGEWTAFGGAGYWINTGAHRRNAWYVGSVLQR